MRAIIAGAGPAGFACAKWLSDRGYEVVLLEKRVVPGGKVSAWRDADGDWVESGLHVFFGAYHQLLNFLAECGLHDSFDWKPAEMVFISPAHGLTPIRFVPRLPAPLNGLAGVAASRLMTTTDKLRMALGLLWPIFGSQAYIDKQDDQSYAAWHLRHGMGQRTLDDLMHTMALALNFQRADQVSAKLVLTALLHFAQETNAPRMGLVKGSPHDRLWAPLIAHLRGRGVRVVLGRKVDHLCYDGAANRITGVSPDYHTSRGSIVELVVAPAEDLIGQPDQVVLERIMADFYRLHPAARSAKLRKYTLVRIPNSVYQARVGVDRYRPAQATPVPNLFLAGDFTRQEFMASIEGAGRS